MQGRNAAECKFFWHGHSCPDNPSINRNKTWSKQENNKLKECVQKNKEKDWIKIAKQHNVCLLYFISQSWHNYDLNYILK